MFNGSNHVSYKYQGHGCLLQPSPKILDHIHMDTLLPDVYPAQVDTYHFPATVKPPGSDKTLFLGGAGAPSLFLHGLFPLDLSFDDKEVF